MGTYHPPYIEGKSATWGISSIEELGTQGCIIYRMVGVTECYFSFFQLRKESVDEYKDSNTVIPSFAIWMQQISNTKPQSLLQKINFEGLDPPKFYITITRNPGRQGT